jgi:hypothetical protein
MNPFDELRAALKLPYNDEPYHKALERAEAEYLATVEAAKTCLLAAVQCFRAPAVTLLMADLFFWVAQAQAAKERLEHQRARKKRV